METSHTTQSTTHIQPEIRLHDVREKKMHVSFECEEMGKTCRNFMLKLVKLNIAANFVGFLGWKKY